MTARVRALAAASAFAFVAAAVLSTGSATRTPPLPAPSPLPRRIAIRALPSVVGTPELERLSGWSRRQGMRIEAGSEQDPVPAGWEIIRVGMPPASGELARRLARFGVRALPSGFEFDGRSYRSAEDAIAVREPGPGLETVVFGNGKPAVLRLVARRLFFREGPPADYQVVSGELGKSGRFGAALASGGAFPVDRRFDRDEIGGRDEFLRSLASVERAGVRWQFAPAQRPSVNRLEALLARFLRKHRSIRIAVRIFPDAAMKARVGGSTRPADLERADDTIRVDVDGSAPASPDLVSPVLAAAAFASEDPRLLARPTLLLALGARACGSFWGRSAAGFSAFARAAGVEPTVEEVIESAEDVSPILAVGAAAAWIDAGVRREGEVAVLGELAVADGKALAASLRRWQADAVRVPVPAPARRPVPAGFLRGLSYAMSNSLEGCYASPRSRETLGGLSRMGANSVSIMPFAFQGAVDRPSLSFVHRSPQGETDEGTVHAVADAREAGMSAMVKPQIWVGDGAFVGRIRMPSDADWPVWFAAYRRFIVHHAIVAEASGAALFCVGTELMDTEGRTAEWRATIGAVRLATGAPLTYAANWATGAVRVPFWDALDLIGVDFYDPPTTDPAATDAALEAGIRAAVRPLTALARAAGKPVVFTEAGYPLAKASWIAPHDENSARPPDGADAARAIAAMYRALGNEPWWKGVYWWKVYSSGRPARPDERGFNVLGGAPEKAVTEGFERLARERSR